MLPYSISSQYFGININAFMQVFKLNLTICFQTNVRTTLVGMKEHVSTVRMVSCAHALQDTADSSVKQVNIP